MQIYRIRDLQQKINTAGFYPMDILLVGATGVGKSSTLNALFGNKVAKVGEGVNPETMCVRYYRLNNFLRFWDSPGLGDGKEADKTHSKALAKVLNRTYTRTGTNTKYYLIDLVLVILDGSSRDMGTTYKLLQDVILKNIQPERVLVAINQCDMAMKMRYWDSQNNSPEPTLLRFLEEKAISIVKRIQESTGITISKPVYYSASAGYNITALMDQLIAHIPTQRKPLYIFIFKDPTQIKLVGRNREVKVIEANTREVLARGKVLSRCKNHTWGYPPCMIEDGVIDDSILVEKFDSYQEYEKYYRLRRKFKMNKVAKVKDEKSKK